MSIAAATTLHIPAMHWPEAITSYLAEYGSPAQIIPSLAEPLEADEVLWGASLVELRCIKITVLAEADSLGVLHNPNFPDSRPRAATPFSFASPHPSPMSPTLLAQTLHVPVAQWVSVINTFYNQLGTPTLVIPAGPLADAEQVAWGTGNAELRCLKEYNASFVPGGQAYFAGCPSEASTTAAFNLLRRAGLQVKEELHTIQEFSLVGGEVKKRDILLGSFYLPQTAKELKDSDTVGVIHNPNYPDAMTFRRGCGATQLLAYGLAGVVGAALATWLGRR